MAKDINNFKKLLVENFSIDKNHVQVLFSELSQELKKVKIASNKIDHVSKIFLNVIENCKINEIKMNIENDKFNHKFLHRYGGDIIRYYIKGSSPAKMLKEDFKYIKNKPVPQTIRNYLIEKDIWKYKIPIKSNSMIEFQKARKDIKIMFDIGLSDDDIFLGISNDNINITSIKKELKNLKEKKALKEYVSKQINLNFDNQFIIDTAPEIYIKSITNNFINTVRKHLNK